MRLIDADALVKNYLSEEINNALSPANKKLVRRFIHIQPTIDAEPVRHGHWIAFNVIDTKDHSSKIRYMCNKCGRYEDEQEPYCNCGAKMDEDEEQ